MDTKTIVVTGGHQTPALAVIEEIQKTHPSWRIVWIGRKYVFEKDRVVSQEYSLVKSLAIQFEELVTGRFDRSGSVTGLGSLLKLPGGIVQALRILKKVQPDCVVSFGGYIALPVAFAASFLHIPVLTHEQTHALGLANRWIARISKKVFVSYPETLTSVPDKKGILTGLPIRSGIFSPSSSPSFSLPKEALPILYITGGSTGAQTLNDIIFPAVPQLLQTMIVIHQTGDGSFTKAKEIKDRLGTFDGRYIIAPFFHVQDIAWIYRHASIVLGRSGANTVAELSAFQKKAVFVPLPWSAGNEQYENARYFQKTGTALIIKQQDLNPASLSQAIEEMLQKPDPFETNTVSFESHAANNVTKEIDNLLSFQE
jgi:UDP-N-acetylglucosamine--N-acetylmuramyl-(pentapeptide) pyrophosphoryl-undecaprenol N-acetylglucosamine transferase